MHEIFIDIETLPDQSGGALDAYREAVQPPGNYKKQDSIDKWLEENREAIAEQEWRKTSFDGAFGEIACIGLAIDSDHPKVFSQHAIGSEEGVLRTALDYLSDVTGWEQQGKHPYLTWIGHNLTNFDIRFIWQRCVINGVKPPVKLPINAKPWSDEIFDTMREWAGMQGRVKLDTLCKALGIEGKPDDIDGSKVWDFWKAGEYQKVADYCAHDVEMTRKVYRKMTFK